MNHILMGFLHQKSLQFACPSKLGKCPGHSLNLLLEKATIHTGRPPKLVICFFKADGTRSRAELENRIKTDLLPTIIHSIIRINLSLL